MIVTICLFALDGVGLDGTEQGIGAFAGILLDSIDEHINWPRRDHHMLASHREN